MYRHGDLLIVPCENRPEDAKRLDHVVLAEGEVTGHHHRIADPATAALYEASDGTLYIDVVAAQASLVHEEHAEIVLPTGVYEVVRQREFDPFEDAVRNVAD